MDTYSVKDEMLDELDAFDPAYQDNYPTLAHAAFAAGPHAIELYQEFLTTDEGVALVKQMITRIDWNDVNRRNKRNALASLGMARESGDF